MFPYLNYVLAVPKAKYYTTYPTNGLDTLFK